MRCALSFSVVIAALLASPLAFADSTTCSKDAEEGQRARANGQLREARERFMACGAEECPSLVHHDCMTWAAEVLALTPTIVVDAKDASGADIADVVVSLDEKVIAQRIDGKALAIDPGPHTLRFEHKGFAPVTQSLIAKEGQKARTITVSFTNRVDGAPPRRGLVSSSPTGTGGHTIYPWIVTAAGGVAVIVGAVLIATTPSLPPGCQKTREQCFELPSDEVRDNPATSAQENSELEDRQYEAGRSEAQPVYGAVMMGAGGLLIVGGLLWHFLETPETPPATSRIRPLVGPRGAALFATF